MDRERVRSDMRLAGLVKRYHTWPTIQQQNVGEHSWQVIRVYAEMFGWPDSDVIRHIFYHDTPELLTGDPPFPVKAENTALAEEYHKLDRKFFDSVCVHISPLPQPEKTMMKIADLMEMWEFGMMEVRLGNQYGRAVVADTFTAAMGLATQIGPEYVEALESFVKQRSET